MNKIVKHLNKNGHKYGIETLVVIVGILIAFALNDWNEGRKEKRFEQKVLAELYSSLQNNIVFLDRAIRQNEEAQRSCQVILDNFSSESGYHDSLNSHFSQSLFWFTPSINSNAYESLKSYGLHLVTNDSIRKKLGEIYEWVFVDRLTNRQEEYFYGTIAPLLTNWFDTYDIFGDMKPTNYNELRKSVKYKHILRTLISNREAQNRIYRITRQDRNDLAGMITNELNKE